MKLKKPNKQQVADWTYTAITGITTLLFIHDKNWFAAIFCALVCMWYWQCNSWRKLCSNWQAIVKMQRAAIEQQDALIKVMRANPEAILKVVTCQPTLQ